jgi:catalase
MATDPSPEELVTAVRKSFRERRSDPDPHPGLRPVHAYGIGAKGYFEASPVARNFCKAAHFGGQQIPATVRFSNGTGNPPPLDKHGKPILRDNWSDVRGMATRFDLGEGRATDLIAMTLGEFFESDLERFKDMLDKTAFAKVRRESPWLKIADFLALRLPAPDPYPGQRETADESMLSYANAHRKPRLGIVEAGAIGAPVSYARATYHAVHTFIVTAPDGLKRHVRFTWQPVAGVRKIKIEPGEPPKPLDLHEELRKRLNPKAPVRFMLMMTIGENGDKFDDPTRPWPHRRERVTMGTLYLEEIVDCEDWGFNPCRLIPGSIDVSEDRILRARKDIYEVSRKLRGGAACPFSGE